MVQTTKKNTVTQKAIRPFIVSLSKLDQQWVINKINKGIIKNPQQLIYQLLTEKRLKEQGVTE